MNGDGWWDKYGAQEMPLRIEEIRFHYHPNHHDWKKEWICNKCCETLNWTKIKEIICSFLCSSSLISFPFCFSLSFQSFCSREWKSFPMHSFRSIKFISIRRVFVVTFESDSSGFLFYVSCIHRRSNVLSNWNRNAIFCENKGEKHV